MEEARLKWVDLAKEHVALATKVRQVSKLEAKVDELKQTMAKLRRVHQAGFRAAHDAEVERLRGLHSTEIERKDAFCEAEKVLVLSEVQASCISKLPGLYDEQYELGWLCRS